MESNEIEIVRLQEKFIAADKALTLSTEEFHRRLGELNGEASRIKDILATCVPREIYDRGIEAVEKASNLSTESMEKRIRELEDYKSNTQGRMWIGGAIVIVMAATIAAVVPLLMK